MKKFRNKILAAVLPLLFSCVAEEQHGPDFSGSPEDLTLPVLAKIFSELPLDSENLREVHDAVSSSLGNGYDEEYMFSDLVASPGAGVGDARLDTRAAASYARPIRDVLAEYFSAYGSTKSGQDAAMECLAALQESDIQIYWPYSDSWDGMTPPVITFDPGFGSETNYGYEMKMQDGCLSVAGTLAVDEELAESRPVWVVNTNDDASYTPADFFEPVDASAVKEKGRVLSIRSVKALRNYDTWFGGASEFFIKCGAVNGFRASEEADMRDYSPDVTDCMIVVRRNQIGRLIPFDALLLTDYTSQMEKIAFLITEDDGGTRTSWDCEAVVKVQSKAYGFSLKIPYNEKDDIVWRGQLSSNFFADQSVIKGRFGDVEISFSLL